MSAGFSRWWSHAPDGPRAPSDAPSLRRAARLAPPLVVHPNGSPAVPGSICQHTWATRPEALPYKLVFARRLASAEGARTSVAGAPLAVSGPSCACPWPARGTTSTKGWPCVLGVMSVFSACGQSAPVPRGREGAGRLSCGRRLVGSRGPCRREWGGGPHKARARASRGHGQRGLAGDE